MRVACAVLVGSLAPACSLIGVERPPPLVEPDTRVVCTETYWLPAADAAAVAAIVGYSIWIAKQIDDGCDRGDPEVCDPQAGLAIFLPLTFGVPPYAISAEIGRRRVRDCREAKGWQRTTSSAPLAGANGAACVPVFGREGRCDAGYCVRGRCQAELPPAKLRMFCAQPIARWRAERDPSRRASLRAALPPACRPLAR